MSDVASVSSRFNAMHAEARQFVVGGGQRSFSSVLESARPVGPNLGLKSDEPSLDSGSGAWSTSSLIAGATRTSSVNTGTLPERAEQWSGPIHDAAARYGLDPDLLTALVWTESAFRPDAVSPAGALGLGQLMPGTAAELGVDPHDPIQNLDGAARYLSKQLDRFGSVELALAAYNAGPGRVIQAGGVPNISETQSYVRIVTARRDELQGTTP